MWPFKRKSYPSLKELPADGYWHVGQGVVDGAPVAVRLQTSLDPFRGHPDLHHQVALVIQLRELTSDGLPTRSELRQLRELEDLVHETFHARRLGILAAVLTRGDRRKFVLYTSEPERVEVAFQELLRRVTSHRITLLIEPDRHWDAYSQVRDALSSAGPNAAPRSQDR